MLHSVTQMNMLKLIMGALIAATFTFPAWADAPGREPAAQDRYAKACSHYANRARFKDRSDNPEFVVVLADSCIAALKSLNSDRPVEKAAAESFLSGLVELRDTVIAMNMERLFGKSYDRSTRIQGPKYQRSEPIAHVSATGEYLIAHRMGLIAARNAWLDTAPDFAFAPQQKG